MNLISIIIPYYRKSKYIEETINSILAQSYKKFEILLIHDDPKNKDYKLLLQLKKKDKRIILIKNKKNLGAGLSRNLGISKCKGSYIAFCDADDTWKKNKLKNQISFMIKNKVFFSYTSFSKINDMGKKIKTIKAPTKQSFNELLKDNPIGLSTVILKKEIMKNTYKFPKLKTKEDLFLWIMISKKYELVGYNKVLSNWRKTKNSLSSNLFQKLKDAFSLYYKYLDFNLFKSYYYTFLLSFNFIKKNFKNDLF